MGGFPEMRTRKTNFLQTVILFTGIIYILTGGLFALSPHLFGNIFSLEINEDWFNEIPKDAFIFMVLTFSRSTSCLLLSIGLSMVLPLFDPLKYRGMVYFTGVVFPLLSALMFTINTFTNASGAMILYAVLFWIILLLTSTALWITRGTVKSGIE